MFLDEPTSGLDPVATREVQELIAALRERGVTIFLTTHRLEEAERLCDRVAIINTTLRLLGRPARAARRSCSSRRSTSRPPRRSTTPRRCSRACPGVEGWQQATRPAATCSPCRTPTAAAPALTRALVGAGADVLSIAESQHSLEDVYLELIDDDVEARRPMSLSRTHVGAVLRKELRDYRRNRFIVVDDGRPAACVFLALPMINVFSIPASASSTAAEHAPRLVAAVHAR